MAYNYYQTQVPGWGTNQFQFGAPPMPGFQPQPSWRGYDFYNAHAMNPDPNFFESIMARVRNGIERSIEHSDARHWHRKVYSGMTPLNALLPEDIGAAAAYEAYRTWKQHSFLYEPLSADRERQREGLTGMAIAETQRLWQYSQRAYDTYGLRAACEAAAAAAYVLADRLFAHSIGGGRGRSPSFSTGSDAYAYDDGYRRGRSRHNSFSSPTVVRVGGSPLMGGSPLPYGGAAPMAVPGMAASAGAAYAAPGMPGSYGAYNASPYGAQPGLPGSYTYGGASPNPYAPVAPAAAPYTFNGVPIGGTGYGAAAPYAGVGQTGYTLPNGQTVPPGSTVIITREPRSRRHSTASSHRHHHHRSSSHSRRDYDYERERERERERELEQRDWERMDRERHERDRLRWEQEERERERSSAYGGGDMYGRYPRMGSVTPGYGGYGGGY